MSRASCGPTLVACVGLLGWGAIAGAQIALLHEFVGGSDDGGEPYGSLILSSSVLYIGNDSGVTHLAASCAVKVVALFRRDLISSWKPNGSVTILSGLTLSQISLDSVWQAIIRML